MRMPLYIFKIIVFSIQHYRKLFLCSTYITTNLHTDMCMCTRFDCRLDGYRLRLCTTGVVGKFIELKNGNHRTVDRQRRQLMQITHK